MTIDAIKNEITARLRDVRADSSQFKLSENCQDLQKLITKAIGKVELCETAEELEAIDTLLTTIEELYNACVFEETGDPSNEIVFDFQFELDGDEYDDTDDSEEDKDETESEENEIVDERSAEREEKKAERKQKHAELYLGAKEAFDEKCPPSVMKKPNIARLCVGLIALISGSVAGLITAQWWPFEWWSWAIIGFGVSYIIITVIYAIVIAVGKASATRTMSSVRLILAPIAAVASLVLGLVFEFDLTLIGAYIATVPFTVCGVFSYFIFRIRLFFTACKLKKRNKEKKRKASEN